MDATPPPPPPPPPAPWSRHPQPPAEPPTNALAIAAFAGSFVVGLVGIICGHLALSQIKRTGQKGYGFALAGTIIGYATTALFVLYLGFIFVFIGAAATVVSHARAALPTEAPTSSADAGPSKSECLLVAKASIELRSALSAITVSQITNDPAGAKAAVVAATEQFEKNTAGASSYDLTTELSLVEEHLAVISVTLVDLQVEEAGHQDLGPVESAFAATANEIDRVDAVCR